MVTGWLDPGVCSGHQSVGSTLERQGSHQEPEEQAPVLAERTSLEEGLGAGAQEAAQEPYPQKWVAAGQCPPAACTSHWSNICSAQGGGPDRAGGMTMVGVRSSGCPQDSISGVVAH